MTSRNRAQPEQAVPRQPPAARPGAAARSRRPAGPAGDPILASKVTVPGVPGWAVQRPRLTELIARGVRWRPLTVLTGPPGAGKTMALTLWAAAEPGPVAWLGLDDYDNRPGAFWSYLVAALRRSGVAIPQSAAARGRAAGHVFLLRLAAALAAQDPPVMLVLDDLHLLTDPEVLNGLDFVLRNAGSRLRLMVASRMDPLLPLHRWRLAGQLTQIRADDLAFSTAEAGLLLAQHGISLTADSMRCLMRRTEGWAAGLRLAAVSMDEHPDPDQFVKELAAEDSALTGYLVQEVLDAQPPEVRDVLLCTSILDQVSADAAVELAGDERAAGILSAAARTNAFIESAGGGRYRYHALFAEVLRLKLRREHPHRVAVVHQRAARWCGRNGLLAEAVRHAALAGDWPLAATTVIDDLAISQILEPQGDQPLAAEFARMPAGQTWTEPQPYLVSAAISLAAGRLGPSVAALDAADGILERRPAGQEAACRLAAALIRLAACLRTGDLTAVVSAAGRAEVLVSQLPAEKLARHPGIRTRALYGRGAAALWSGHLDEATRVLQAAATAQTASGRRDDPAGCLGLLAMAEALRGRLRHAAELAGQAARAGREHQPPGQDPDPAVLVALAWVHLDRHELPETRRYLQQADTALGVSPDLLIGTVAHLVAAGGALAEGRAAAAAQIITRARSGRPVPAWLDQQLSLLSSRAYTASGDIPAALAAARQAADGSSPSLEAAVTLAHAWAAAGDCQSARHALAPALAAGRAAPDRVRLHARLVDARLNYATGDPARGRQAVAAALRLAEHEQVRLPFVVERSWIGPALQHDPDLAEAHRRLLAPAAHATQPPAPPGIVHQDPVLVVEPLSEREQEVLRHLSGMLSTAEIASEMYISVNTVKTHLRAIYRKLAATRRGEAVRRARQLELI